MPSSIGISVAPGAPIVMRGGRSVMADDAAAARERRMNRKVRREKPWPPRPVEAATAAPVAPAAAPAPAPAPADATSGSATQANGGATAPAAAAKAPAKAAPKAAPKKKAPEPLGW